MKSTMMCVLSGMSILRDTCIPIQLNVTIVRGSIARILRSDREVLIYPTANDNSHPYTVYTVIRRDAKRFDLCVYIHKRTKSIFDYRAVSPHEVARDLKRQASIGRCFAVYRYYLWTREREYRSADFSQVWEHNCRLCAKRGEKRCALISRRRLINASRIPWSARGGGIASFLFFFLIIPVICIESVSDSSHVFSFTYPRGMFKE